MTDKEMHRLSRRELLQLLLAQVSETEELKQLLAERDDQLISLHDNYEHLRRRLDQKDAKIHELRDTLRQERNTRRIELQEAGSIAEAALRLNGIFETAQKAADLYLENVKRLAEGTESEKDILSESEGGEGPAMDTEGSVKMKKTEGCSGHEKEERGEGA